MALGGERATGHEAEVSGRWATCEQQRGGSSESKEQLPRLEAEGGPASPVWGAEVEVGSSGAAPCCPSAASSSCREPTSGASKPGCVVPPGEPLLPAGQMEEGRSPAPEELPQTSVCSGHEADTEEEHLSPAESPHPSCSPSRWRAVGRPGATSPLCAGSNARGHPAQAEPRNSALTQMASSWELTVPGPQLRWSPQPLPSSAEESALGRGRLSFQAEYWACVLPDSLPPSPDRSSPLWNPNREYEELLDYTYPLRPGPQLSKHRSCRVSTDVALQDSGVDLDSFSISPASTLKSPTNVSYSCPPAEATALSFLGPAESHFKRQLPRTPPKQGMGFTPGSQFASTPVTTSHQDGPWASRESVLRRPATRLAGSTRLEMGTQPRTWNQGWPTPWPGSKKETQQSGGSPVYTEPGCRAEAEVESDEEYLALPTRLTQISSLASYLGSNPDPGSLHGTAANAQSSEASDSEGPTSLPSDYSQSQLPSGTALRRAPVGQKPWFVQAQNSREAQCTAGSQAQGISAGLLKAAASLPATSEHRAFSDSQAGGQPCKGEQGRESLLQCMKTFCCQLEELILWLYNVADITKHLAPPKSNLKGLKSSLQLYRQFKKDIAEHQPLTESVLQKGEILLQCLLDNIPVLKDVLERISQQPSELENHAEHLYDSLLASLDVLAGCTLTPDTTTRTHTDSDRKLSLASSQAEI